MRYLNFLKRLAFGENMSFYRLESLAQSEFQRLHIVPVWGEPQRFRATETRVVMMEESGRLLPENPNAGTCELESS